MNRTVFISSTFEDLKDHRKQVWDTLTKYDVNIRGMEQFGARKEAPLQTCLAEVEQSDIFVGIIGCRLGTVYKKSGKSFVQCEYEKALELKKNILIYLIDEKEGNVKLAHIDYGEEHEKLKAFKSILKDRHTIDTFKDIEDLAEKLKRKFDELLTKKGTKDEGLIDEYKRSKELLNKFLILPNAYSGKIIKLQIKFDGNPFPASKAICDSFYLSYGKTIGDGIKIVKPVYEGDAFKYLFLDHKQAVEYFELNKKKEVNIYAALRFTKKTIESVQAKFVSTTTYTAIAPPLYAFDPRSIQVDDIHIEPAEGHIIIQLSDFEIHKQT